MRGRLFSPVFEKEKRDWKRRVFIAYEGSDTEPKYFEKFTEYIKNNKDTQVGIFPLDRSDNNSHPIHVRDGIIDFYKEKLKKSFDKTRDELWIVIDIDKHFKKKIIDGIQYSEKEMYLKYLETLVVENKIYINAAISNPCFELWTILHFKKAEELDLIKIKENKKRPKSRSYIKKELTNIKNQETGFTQVSDYINLIPTAIKNSESNLLTNDIKEIFDNVGTSVNKLFKSILS